MSEAISIEVNIEQIIRDRKRCHDNHEKELEFYCNCLLKMVRAYNKIEQTELLYYISRIMKHVFPLVCRYFHDRIERYFGDSDYFEKQEILKDTEESIVEFSDVFHTIINSTNSADRILFQTAPLNVGMRYAAPKLCVYYTSALNYLSGVLEKDSGQSGNYGFCVYPTLNSHAAAVLLFSSRKEKGKVGIIRLPQKDIADIDHLKIYFLHELFHIVPGNLRYRKRRAGLFANILLYDIYDSIFSSCDQRDIEKIGDKLQEYMFSDLISEFEKTIVGHEEDDRLFYSKEIMENFASQIIAWMQNMQKISKSEFLSYIIDKRDIDFLEFNSYSQSIKNVFDEMKRNIGVILSDSRIKLICEFFMDLFREVYSDLLTITTLELLPEEYFSTFYSNFDGIEKKVIAENISFKLRVILVTKTLSNCYDKEKNSSQFLEKWAAWPEIEGCGNKYVDSIKSFDEELSKVENDSEDSQNSDPPEPENRKNKAAIVNVNDKMMEAYIDYFQKCCVGYLEFMKRHEKEFDTFRQKYFFVSNISYENKIKNIISSVWEENVNGNN